MDITRSGREKSGPRARAQPRFQCPRLSRRAPTTGADRPGPAGRSTARVRATPAARPRHRTGAPHPVAPPIARSKRAGGRGRSPGTGRRGRSLWRGRGLVRGRSLWRGRRLQGGGTGGKADQSAAIACGGRGGAGTSHGRRLRVPTARNGTWQHWRRGPRRSRVKGSFPVAGAMRRSARKWESSARSGRQVGSGVNIVVGSNVGGRGPASWAQRDLLTPARPQSAPAPT